VPSWTTHKAEIYEFGSGLGAGALVGTITNLLANGAEGTNSLDEAGSGWIKIHGADTPSLSLCTDFRICRVTAVSSVTSQAHEICCFIIQERKPEVVGRQVTYTISGPDLIGSIKFGNLGYNVISDNMGGASLTPIQDLLDSYTTKSWTITSHGTAPNGAVAVGAGETSYVALINMLFQLDAHFSFSLKNNPSFGLHMWYEHTASSGPAFDALTLLETANPASYQADPTVAVITEPITVIKEPQERFTSAYIYGAGMGVDRWTFEDYGLDALVIPGWAHSGSTSIITNTALEATIPRIRTTKQFAELEPIDPSDPVSVAANAKAIFYSGYTWLKYRTKAEIVYYEINNLVIHADLIPGQLVHVTYNRSSPVNSSGSMVSTDIIDLDDDLIVLGIKHKIGASGIRYTSLLVGDTPKRPSTGLNMMAEKLKELEDTVKHTNAGSGTPGAPTGSSSYLWASGSGPILTGDLLVDPLVTIDGVDISAHAADPDTHHTPGTLSATTINFNNGVETHLIDASSNPGPQVYLLKTDAGGRIVLVRADLDSLVLTDRATDIQYNVFINNGLMYIEPI
jgi:hypothetical protein